MVEPVEDDAVNVAIVGRPNVGKSTLLNKLVNAERSIVSTLPGTTRDAVDELVERDGTMYRLIDTAGIRRKKGVEYGTEFFMINRAFNAIRRSDVSSIYTGPEPPKSTKIVVADRATFFFDMSSFSPKKVALIVVDGLQEIADQDGKIAERIRDEGRAAVIICNKWDMVRRVAQSIPVSTTRASFFLFLPQCLWSLSPTRSVSSSQNLSGSPLVSVIYLHRQIPSLSYLQVENKDNKSWSKMNDYIKESFPMVSWAPIVIISALTGQRTQNLYKVSIDVEHVSPKQPARQPFSWSLPSQLERFV